MSEPTWQGYSQTEEERPEPSQEERVALWLKIYLSALLTAFIRSTLGAVALLWFEKGMEVAFPDFAFEMTFYAGFLISLSLIIFLSFIVRKSE